MSAKLPAPRESHGDEPLRTALPSIRRHVLMGTAACAIVLFGFGGWMALAHIAGAVIVPGTVVVESSLKKVQHPTGGVIGALNVKDGDSVTAGDVVIRLDETITRASLGVIVHGLSELDGREARLLAEREGRDHIEISEALARRSATDPAAAEIVAGEKRLFSLRRDALAGQRAQLVERTAQLDREIEGQEARLRSIQSQTRFVGDELKGITALYEKQLVPISRWAALQREAARLDGERGRIIADIASAKGKIAETRLQIIQLDRDRSTDVAKELRDIDAKRGELLERRTAAEDQLKRVDIRAPQSGTVHALAVHTVGGVVGPGETLMYIVPKADTLVIEGHVTPRDIDQVKAGQDAIVRLTAFNQRTTPELFGRLARVAPDLTNEQPAGGPDKSYYTVRVDFSDTELARLGELKLRPGMPAEVHIQTGTRTALSYFTKPLADQLARTFREQ